MAQGNFFSSEESLKVHQTALLFLGVGSAGSVIADCALRFGFSRMTIVDNTKVELHDLNSQSFSVSDIGDFKAEVIRRQLLKINPSVEVYIITDDIETVDFESLIVKHNIAVNLYRQFPSSYSVQFDSLCLNHDVPVLHAYNVGWAGIVTVINKLNQSFEWSNLGYRSFVKRVADYYRFWGAPKLWLESVLRLSDECKISIGSWNLGGLVVTVLYDVVTANNVRYYPQFYMMTIMT